VFRYLPLAAKASEFSTAFRAKAKELLQHLSVKGPTGGNELAFVRFFDELTAEHKKTPALPVSPEARAELKKGTSIHICVYVRACVRVCK